MREVIGYTHYRGIIAAQHYDFAEVLTPFLTDNKFDAILEVGTYKGGFTLFLRDVLPNAQITTYDIHPAEHLGIEFLEQFGVKYKQKSIFCPHTYKVIDQDFLSKIANSGKLLVVVDGGNKIAEFNAIAPHIKVGDHIMCHDFAMSLEHFNTNILGKLWNCCEITENDIAQVCQQHNLVTVHPELNNIVWQCKKKI